jgi:hypothetical protein
MSFQSDKEFPVSRYRNENLDRQFQSVRNGENKEKIALPLSSDVGGSSERPTLYQSGHGLGT